MQLTPIKSRGKVRTREWRDLMKLRKQLMSEDKPRDDSSRKRRKTEKARLHLEALPPELLQHIFISSCEINLPLASPRLARKLSSRQVYMQFCFEAFYMDDYFLLNPEESYTQDDLADVGFKCSDSPAANKEESLQSCIFQRKWLTWDLYHEYLQKAFEACKLEYGEWKEDAQNKLTQTDQSKRLTLIERKLEEPQPIDFDAEDFALCKGPEYRWFRLLPDCFIPEKLFHVPFDRDRITFLKTMVRAGATVDWYTSAAGERAEAALEHAIAKGRSDAIRLLLHEAIGVPWQDRYLEQAYKEQTWQPKTDFEPIIELLKEKRRRDERQRH